MMMSPTAAKVKGSVILTASSFDTSCVSGCRTASPIAAPCPATSAPAATTVATMELRNTTRMVRLLSDWRLDDCNLHVVNRRQRIEQAFELRAPFSAHPELAGGRPEVERRRLQLVYRHRVATNRKVALLLRQP